MIDMKIAERPQQGRTGKGRTGKKARIVCPKCGGAYLQAFYGKDHGLRRKGLYCPECDYCKQDERVN